MIGIVDDSNACVNDFFKPDQPPDILLGRATTDANCGTIYCVVRGAAPKFLNAHATSLIMGFLLRGIRFFELFSHSLRFGSKNDQNSLRHPSSIYLLVLPTKRWDATNHPQTTSKRG
jgi:hypothetical protein